MVEYIGNMYTSDESTIEPFYGQVRPCQLWVQPFEVPGHGSCCGPVWFVIGF